ncbi:hypothetical protein FIS3754_27720 [Fischerella sp. NIES-3754]|nr:hypothetical protein FIS3754_27720 [Fischerella sp. NIES-3754]BCX09164.1 MAG: hypothetical protein KatS3mg066_3023 [Fischerella sp.]
MVILEISCQIDYLILYQLKIHQNMTIAIDLDLDGLIDLSSVKMTCLLSIC